jgi:hypothetical protein
VPPQVATDGDRPGETPNRAEEAVH